VAVLSKLHPIRRSYHVTDQNGNPSPFKLTLAPWRIKEKKVRNAFAKPGDDPYTIKLQKVFALTGTVERYERGTVTAKTAGDQQMGFVHSPKTGTMVIDADHEDFYASAVWEYLERTGARPISVRAEIRRHWLVDAAWAVQRGLWVTQGAIVGGDIKSNGFTPVPGCTHPSGDLYEPQLDEAGNLHVVELTEELYQLLRESRGTKSQAQGLGGGGLGTGQEPALFSLTGRLVARGMDVEAAWAVWLETALAFENQDPSWPWSEDDRDVFDGHWARVQEMEEQKRKRQADTGKSPGHSVFPVNMAEPVEGPVLRTGKSPLPGLMPWDDVDEDLPDHRLVDPKKLDAKLAAERNRHALSRDWDDSPEGELNAEAKKITLDCAEVYQRLVYRQRAGTIPTSDFLRSIDPTDACRHWLAEHRLIAVYRGSIALFADPQRPEKASEDPYPAYPGWSHGVNQWGEEFTNPKAGYSWTREHHEKLDHRVEEFYAAAEGSPFPTTQAMAAAYLNDPERRATDGTEAMRGATTGHVSASLRRLVEQGRLHVDAEKVMYRKKHMWWTIPAKYAAGPDPKPVEARHSTKRQNPRFVVTPKLEAWARAVCGGHLAASHPAKAVPITFLPSGPPQAAPQLPTSLEN
jgi:hypothetical protein